MLLNFSLVLWTSVSAAPVCCTALGISDRFYWHIQDTSQRSKHCFLIGKGTINFWSSPGWLRRNIGGSTWKPMKVVCKFQRALSSNVFQRWTYNEQLRCHEGAFVGTFIKPLALHLLWRVTWQGWQCSTAIFPSFEVFCMLYGSLSTVDQLTNFCYQAALKHFDYSLTVSVALIAMSVAGGLSIACPLMLALKLPWCAMNFTSRSNFSKTLHLTVNV